MVRRICISIAATALAGLGVLATAGPGHADSSWGYKAPPAYSGTR